MTSVTCDYCGKPAELVDGTTVYPHRQDLGAKKFWRCAPCHAYVGCHDRGANGSDGTLPLGRLANAELRDAKKAAHARFDPIWKARRMGRNDAYRWLAKALGICVKDCHIGMFDLAQCRAVVAAVEDMELTS